jgi:hypothetical protein
MLQFLGLITTIQWLQRPHSIVARRSPAKLLLNNNCFETKMRLGKCVNHWLTTSNSKFHSILIATILATIWHFLAWHFHLSMCSTCNRSNSKSIVYSPPGTYSWSGCIIATFVSTYGCTKSCNGAFITYVFIEPCGTSLARLYSSYASQTRLYTKSNLCKFSITNPMHSFFKYPSTIDDSGCAILQTYAFNVFMYLSTGYIHLLDMGPYMSNSCTK